MDFGKKRIFLLFFFFGLSIPEMLVGTILYAQDQQSYNRFQYHKYTWETLHTTAFHLYFPKGNDSLASFASAHLPDIMEELKREMGVTVKDIPNIIIYPSPDQLYESNIGMYEQKVQTFPTINLKGNRLLVAFDGSWERFREQIKEAWARMCWESQFPEDMEEQLTNKKQLMPTWFKEGAIRYYTKGWDLADEREWTTLVNARQESFAGFAQRHKALAGQAFCYFLSQRYREDAAKQIIFQLRQGKSLARSVRLVTKRTLDTLQEQCDAFYKDRLKHQIGTDIGNDTLVTYIEQRFEGTLFALSFTKDSSLLYFVMEETNKRKIYLTKMSDLLDEKQKIKPFAVYQMPPWLEDFEKDRYPVMDWERQDKGLFLTMPIKGNIVLQQYDLMGNLRYGNKLHGVDGTNNLLDRENGRFLLSAYRKGRSDIVLYDARKLNYTTLTADKGDHTELALDEGEGTIVYRSGYPTDSLYHKDTMSKPYGAYSKSIKGEPREIAKQRDKLLYRDTAFLQGHNPMFGPDGSMSLEVRDYGYIQRKQLNGPTINNTLPSPWLKDYLADTKRKDSIRSLLDKLKKNDVPLLDNILTPGNTKELARTHKDSVRKSLAYSPKRVRPYILQLYSAYFSAQVNNDYFINRYQPYQSYLGTFKFPEVGAMLQSGFSDLFDNHRFNIGYRMPAGTEGSDFFVRYGNSAKKLDWHLLYFRKMESLKTDAGSGWKDNRGNPYPLSAKVKTHYYEIGFHYPLRYDWSLDLMLAARNDKTIFLATDRYSLNYDPLKTWWSINTLSLRADKLKPTMPFLYKGWEANLLLDGMASTGKASTMLYGARLKAAWHQPLLKNINLVTRLQAGHSGGQSKILYNFGGTDNNVAPRLDTTVKFAQDAPYAFQTLVTPFRGHEQNSIYGSAFALANVDLYVPLFQGLIPWQPNFPMLRTLQLGIFGDMAVANKPILLPATVSPLYAYGLSARTMLAGYPVRFDLAWPGSFDNKPVWYLSFSLK